MHLSTQPDDAVSMGGVSQDVSLWRRLAKMSSDQGFMRQAIYCYNKVIAANKADLDAQWDRAVLYSNVDEPRKVTSMWPRPPVRWLAAQQVGQGWDVHAQGAHGRLCSWSSDHFRWFPLGVCSHASIHGNRAATMAIVKAVHQRWTAGLSANIVCCRQSRGSRRYWTRGPTRLRPPRPWRGCTSASGYRFLLPLHQDALCLHQSRAEASRMPLLLVTRFARGMTC